VAVAICSVARNRIVTGRGSYTGTPARKCASDAAVRLPPMELGLIVIVVAFALTLLLLVFWW
jgi:hypothetical protein